MVMKKILLTNLYKVLLTKHTNLLMNWGFHVFATTSGTEALKLQKEHNFDLIVVDFELEDMSGCTLCSKIRREENSQHVKIIITCSDIPERMERANLCGPSAIIIKPIAPITLLEVIGDHVGLHLIRGKRVALEVVIKVNNNGEEFICLSRDISKTGILIKSHYALNLGNQITCKFTLPNYRQVEIEGEVCRYMTDVECDNLYGVKFISISSYYQSAISNYIASCSNQYSGAEGIKSEPIILNKNKERAIEKRTDQAA